MAQLPCIQVEAPKEVASKADAVEMDWNPNFSSVMVDSFLCFVDFCKFFGSSVSASSLSEDHFVMIWDNLRS